MHNIFFHIYFNTSNEGIYIEADLYQPQLFSSHINNSITNKLKAMLLSFALLAAVGSALAFKARFLALYCIAETNGQASNVCTSIGGLLGEKKFCPHLRIIRIDMSIGATQFLCTTSAQDLDGGGIDDDCTNIRCDEPTTLYQD